MSGANGGSAEAARPAAAPMGQPVQLDLSDFIALQTVALKATGELSNVKVLFNQLAAEANELRAANAEHFARVQALEKELAELKGTADPPPGAAPQAE